MATLKELTNLTGEAFDATPEQRAALLKAPRASHNGAYSLTVCSQALKRAEYIKALFNGSAKPSNVKTEPSLKALKTFIETYQISFDEMVRYWNGTSGSAYPRITIDGETVTLRCQQVWTLSERFAHKLGQIWGQEVKANPKLERVYPLNPVTKPAEAPKPVAKPVAPKATAEPKTQDFKAVIAAMRKAGIPADLILKTLESL